MYAQLSKARRLEKKIKEKGKKKEEALSEHKDDYDLHDDLDECDSSGGSEPDLSWLPDPDKVYNTDSDESERYFFFVEKFD